MKHIFIGLVAMMVLTSCWTDKSHRNWEYAPNMFYTIALEPYSQGIGNPVFGDSLNAQRPPEGTVPRSESWYVNEAHSPYGFPNTLEGYDSAGVRLTNPLDNETLNAADYECSEETFQKGKRIYEVYCSMCHGTNGKGNGNLVQSGKLGGVPDYTAEPTRSLPQGKIFHTLTYGKNAMGSYASQLTTRERWEVVCYVQYLQQQ